MWNRCSGRSRIWFFTGDLVNDRANEAEEYLNIFDKIKAPLGVFSTLGNHDYGACLKFTSAKAKLANLSHDPTHWDKEVSSNYPDIDVMFGEHNHGTQFGVTVGGKAYSPAQWSYKQWPYYTKKVSSNCM